MSLIILKEITGFKEPVSLWLHGLASQLKVLLLVTWASEESGHLWIPFSFSAWARPRECVCYYLGGKSGTKASRCDWFGWSIAGNVWVLPLTWMLPLSCSTHKLISEVCTYRQSFLLLYYVLVNTTRADNPCVTGADGCRAASWEDGWQHQHHSSQLDKTHTHTHSHAHTHRHTSMNSHVQLTPALIAETAVWEQQRCSLSGSTAQDGPPSEGAGGACLSV